jgi:pyruvate dehydrogenase E1 component alpha subunit
MAIKTKKITTAKTESKAVKTTSRARATESKTAFPKATYIRWYKDMLLMRKFEERTGVLYIQQKFGGFCHLYTGQEAVLAGTTEALKPTDNMITAYRDHAHPLALGTDPKRVMAEMYGKITGTSKGKGGSMHMFDKEKNLFGGHGIVGGQIPLGAGIAFADKYKKNKNVTICFFGDGASRQGGLHETFNMAMTWKLPVIFVIENNNYAMGTSLERTSNVHDLSKLGLAYDMPSETVDGMSPEAVADAVGRAADRARKGDGPTLLDIKTYRYKGHSMSDPQKYRSKEEVQQYQDRDPIDYVLGVIRKNKWMTEKQIAAVMDDVKSTVEEAVKFAEDSPAPGPEELYIDVYKEDNYPYVND